MEPEDTSVRHLHLVFRLLRRDHQVTADAGRHPSRDHPTSSRARRPEGRPRHNLSVMRRPASSMGRAEYYRGTVVVIGCLPTRPAIARGEEPLSSLLAGAGVA
jgi:hypothetical protein